MNAFSHKPFVYLGVLCIILLLVSVVAAQTTATITITGIVKEPPPDPIKKPEARFYANRYFGITPYKVIFTDASKNNPTSYLWKFGDGTTSTIKNPPQHTYLQPGLYRVQLTVSNSAGSDTARQFVMALPQRWWMEQYWKIN